MWNGGGLGGSGGWGGAGMGLRVRARMNFVKILANIIFSPSLYIYTQVAS